MANRGRLRRSAAMGWAGRRSAAPRARRARGSRKGQAGSIGTRRSRSKEDPRRRRKERRPWLLRKRRRPRRRQRRPRRRRRRSKPSRSLPRHSREGVSSRAVYARPSVRRAPMEGRACAWPSFSGRCRRRAEMRPRDSALQPAVALAIDENARSCTNHFATSAPSAFRLKRRRAAGEGHHAEPVHAKSTSSSADTVRQFCERELAPHVDEWERDELFPNWVFKRAGELGIFGAHYPEEVGGAGGDFWFSVAKSEELPRCLMAGVTMGLLVQADMATPVINDLGTKEQKDEFLDARHPRREDRRARRERAERGQRRRRHPDRRRRRTATTTSSTASKTFITNGTPRRLRHAARRRPTPTRAPTAAASSSCPTKTKGFHVSKKLKKIGNHSSDTAELHFEDMRVPKRYLLGEENMGFMYLMQNFQSERIIACTSACAGGRAHARRGHRVRARPQGVRQADHQARVLAAQVRRPRRRSSRRRRRSPTRRRRGVQRGQVRQEGQRLASRR